MKMRIVLRQLFIPRRNGSFFAHASSEESVGARLKGRQWLAGSNGESMPEYLHDRPNKYLKVVRMDDTAKKSDLSKVGEAMREYINDNMGRYSAILFRNLPISNGTHFDKVLRGTDFAQMEYISGNASRAKVTGDTYEASNEPETLSIDLHNEMCYLDAFPRHILFCCITPPTTDGETPIAFNRDIIEKLHPDFVEAVERKGIRYIRNYANKNLTNYMTWQDIFNTSSKKEVEDFVRGLGSEWVWNGDESLTTWYVKSPVIYHPETGEKIWFNQLHAAHNSYYKQHPSYAHLNLRDDQYVLHTTYGDGTEFEDHWLQHLREVSWQVATSFKWQNGDVIVLDNLLCQHGRISYEGSRKIVVGLCNQVDRKVVASPHSNSKNIPSFDNLNP